MRKSNRLSTALVTICLAASWLGCQAYPENERDIGRNINFHIWDIETGHNYFVREKRSSERELGNYQVVPELNEPHAALGPSAADKADIDNAKLGREIDELKTKSEPTSKDNVKTDNARKTNDMVKMDDTVEMDDTVQMDDVVKRDDESETRKQKVSERPPRGVSKFDQQHSPQYTEIALAASAALADSSPSSASSSIAISEHSEIRYRLANAFTGIIRECGNLLQHATTVWGNLRGELSLKSELINAASSSSVSYTEAESHVDSLLERGPRILELLLKEPHHLLAIPEMIISAVPAHHVVATLERLMASIGDLLLITEEWLISRHINGHLGIIDRLVELIGSLDLGGFSILDQLTYNSGSSATSSASSSSTSSSSASGASSSVASSSAASSTTAISPAASSALSNTVADIGESAIISTETIEVFNSLLSIIRNIPALLSELLEIIKSGLSSTSLGGIVEHPLVTSFFSLGSSSAASSTSSSSSASAASSSAADVFNHAGSSGSSSAASSASSSVLETAVVTPVINHGSSIAGDLIESELHRKTPFSAISDILTPLLLAGGQRLSNLEGSSGTSSAAASAAASLASNSAFTNYGGEHRSSLGPSKTSSSATASATSTSERGLGGSGASTTVSSTSSASSAASSAAAASERLAKSVGLLGQYLSNLKIPARFSGDGGSSNSAASATSSSPSGVSSSSSSAAASATSNVVSEILPTPTQYSKPGFYSIPSYSRPTLYAGPMYSPGSEIRSTELASSAASSTASSSNRISNAVPYVEKPQGMPTLYYSPVNLGFSGASSAASSSASSASSGAGLNKGGSMQFSDIGSPSIGGLLGSGPIASSSASAVSSASSQRINDIPLMLPLSKILNTLGTNSVLPGDCIAIGLDGSTLVGWILDDISPVAFRYLGMPLEALQSTIYPTNKMWQIGSHDFQDGDCKEAFRRLRGWHG